MALQSHDPTVLFNDTSALANAALDAVAALVRLCAERLGTGTADGDFDGESLAPVDESLGLVSGWLARLAQELATLTMSQFPSREAASPIPNCRRAGQGPPKDREARDLE